MLFSNADLKKLIFPLIIEQLLSILVGMADSIMVSSVGEAAVSAVSLVDSINILLFYVFSAVATGGAVVAGQYLGSKRNKEACDSCNPVSYTHLDVYKRQSLSCISLSGKDLFPARWRLQYMKQWQFR